MLLIATIVSIALQSPNGHELSPRGNAGPHGESGGDGKEASSAAQTPEQNSLIWDDNVAESILEVENEMEILEVRARSLLGESH